MKSDSVNSKNQKNLRNLQELRELIVQNVGVDEVMRKKLYDAPKATIKKILAENNINTDNLNRLQFRIVEDTCSLINIVLPPLSEDTSGKLTW
jgi:hypothetical protein